MSSPIFSARFFDDVETRMTIWHAENRKTLDLGRGIALSRHAYRQRTGEEPPAIVAGCFERDGAVLIEYSAEQIQALGGD